MLRQSDAGARSLLQRAGVNVAALTQALDGLVKRLPQVQGGDGQVQIGRELNALLNATDIGQQVGVKGQTISLWLDTLQRNALAVRLQPFHTNLNKRIVKTPKVYFLDVGLAAHLQGWRTAEPLLASPQAGPLFETLVFGELIRARDHCGLSLDVSFWRTKEGEEIDFLVRTNGASGPGWIAIEAKFSIQQVEPVAVPPSLAKAIPEIRETWVVTPGGTEQKLSRTSTQVPIRQLTKRLRNLLSTSDGSAT